MTQNNEPSEATTENSEESLIIEVNRRFLARQKVCEDSGDWITGEPQEGEVPGCMTCGS